MSVVLRCPSCQAKLRLDEAPPVGTMIDCPKCGIEFPVRNTSKEDKAKAPDEAKPTKGGKAKKGKTVESKEREFMNEFALLGIVGGAMLALMLTLGITWVILNRTAKTEDLIACVPDGYPAIRGVYLEQMRKMPGFQDNVDAVYTKEIQAGFAVIAKGLGLDPEKCLSYLVMAYTGASGQSVELYLFRCKDSFDRTKVDKIENIRTAKDPSGRTFYAFDGSHSLTFLKGAVVDCPTKNLIVVTRNDLNGKAAAEAAALAVNKPLDGTQKKIGDVGRLAIKAHFWIIVRPVGIAKDSLVGLANTVGVDKEFSKVAAATKASQVFAMWVTFGSTSLRCGAGIECQNSKEAKELVKSMQEGPLGKADESDPPNGLRVNLPLVGMKKVWGEFLQTLSFNQRGTAAYIRVESTNPDNQPILYDFFTLKTAFAQVYTPPVVPPSPPK